LIVAGSIDVLIRHNEDAQVSRLTVLQGKSINSWVRKQLCNHLCGRRAVPEEIIMFLDLELPKIGVKLKSLHIDYCL